MALVKANLKTRLISTAAGMGLHTDEAETVSSYLDGIASLLENWTSSTAWNTTTTIPVKLGSLITATGATKGQSTVTADALGAAALTAQSLIYGGAGADTISGTTANAIMYGGAGADIFKFTATDSTFGSTATGAGGMDVIADFTSGTDKIDLSAFAGVVTITPTENGFTTITSSSATGTNPFMLKVNGTVVASDIMYNAAAAIRNAAALANNTTLNNATVASNVAVAIGLTATSAVDLSNGTDEANAINVASSTGVVVYGGGGNDTFNVTAGKNMLVGGAGNDTFKFSASSSPSTARNIIADFTTGADKIDLSSFAGSVLLSTPDTNGIYTISYPATGTATFSLKVRGVVNNSDILLNAGGALQTAGVGGATDTAMRAAILTAAGLTVDSAIGNITTTSTTGATVLAVANISNIVRGGVGADTIVGAAGKNILLGGSGNDVFRFAQSASTAETTNLIADFTTGDKIDLSAFAGNVTIGAANSDGIATLTAGDFVLKVKGTVTPAALLLNADAALAAAGVSDATVRTAFLVAAGLSTTTNSVTTTAPVVRVSGTANADSLAPVAGVSSIVVAGDGADTLSGAAGKNILVGGAGGDVFKFLATDSTSTNVNLVADFVSGTDKIDLSAFAGSVTITAGTDGAPTTITSSDAPNFSLKVAGTVTADDVLFKVDRVLNAVGITDTTAQTALLTAAQVATNVGASYLMGTAEADTLNAAGKLIVAGGAGADTLIASAGKNVLLGGAGNDVFKFAATASNSANTDFVADFAAGDKIDLTDESFSGAVQLATANGITTITSGDFVVRVNGTVAYTDLLLNAASQTATFGKTAAEVATANGGTAPTVKIFGTATAESLNLTGAGSAVVYGGAGNDTIGGAGGSNILVGGAGADIFKFTATQGVTTDTANKIIDFNVSNGDKIDLTDSSFTGVVTATTADGMTTITSGDFVLKVAGTVELKDIILSAASRAATFGDAANDETLTALLPSGSLPEARILGTAAGDVLNSTGDVAAVVFGGAGADTIHGGVQKTVMVGGAGNDVFLFTATSSGNTNLDIVADFTAGDKIDLTHASFSAPVQLATANGITTVTSGDFVLKVNGVVSYSDLMLNAATQTATFGKTAAEVATANGGTAPTVKIFGAATAESLNLTGAGSAVVYGGAGNDTIGGAGGSNILVGGIGADTFKFIATQGVTNDTANKIIDLNLGAGDKIDLTDSSFSGAVAVATADGMTTITSGDFVLKVAGTVGLSDIMLSAASRVATFGAAANDETLTALMQGADLPAARILGNPTAENLNTSGNVAAVVFGGAGADTIHGGPQKTVMVGGAGNDVFKIDDAAHSSTAAGMTDVVADFTAGDKIDVSAFAGTVIIGERNTTTGVTEVTSADAPNFKLLVKSAATLTDGDFTFNDVLAQQHGAGIPNPTEFQDLVDAANVDVGMVALVQGSSGSDSDLNATGEGGSIVIGKEGADVLFGTGGSNVLLGGAGNDTYSFTADEQGNLIADFSAGDKIDLSDVSFNAPLELQPSNAENPFAMITIGDFALKVHGAVNPNDIILNPNSRMQTLGIEDPDALKSEVRSVAIGLGYGDVTLTTPVFGGVGNDMVASAVDGGVVYGVNGDDTLTATNLKTILVGGDGHDVFKFTATDSVASTSDVILDFTQGQDRIDLTDSSFNSAVTITQGVDGGLNTITAGSFVLKVKGAVSLTDLDLNVNSMLKTAGEATPANVLSLVAGVNTGIYGAPGDAPAVQLVIGTNAADGTIEQAFGAPQMPQEGDTPPPPAHVAVIGGTGADVIGGANGDNILIGGAGNDTFVFMPNDSSTAAGHYDVIADFTTGSDKLDLSGFAGNVTIGTLTNGVIDITSVNAPDFKVKVKASAQGDITLTDIVLNKDISLVNAGVAGNPEDAHDLLVAVRTLAGTVNTATSSLVENPIIGTTGNNTLDVSNTINATTQLQGYAAVLGGSGNDVLRGQFGGNVLVGGTGNDTFVVQAADSVITGGKDANTVYDFVAGSDKIDLSSFAGAVTIGARDNTTNITEITSVDLPSFKLRVKGDVVTNDSIILNPVKALITAGVGVDAGSVATITTLVSGVNNTQYANDTLANKIGTTAGETLAGLANTHSAVYGGAGEDTLTGAGGNNILVGGTGKDTFKYTTASDSTASNFDVIADFVSGTDKIDLTGFAGRVNIDTVTEAGNNIVQITSPDAASFLLKVKGTVTANDILLSQSIALNTAGITGDAQTAALALVDAVKTAKSLNISASAVIGTGDANNISVPNEFAADTSLKGQRAIYAGAGNDTIQGQFGGNVMLGGAGADVFKFAAGDSINAAGKSNVIADFSHADNDKIDVSTFAGDVTISAVASGYITVTSADDATFRAYVKAAADTDVVKADFIFNQDIQLKTAGFTTADLDAGVNTSIKSIVNTLKASQFAANTTFATKIGTTSNDGSGTPFAADGGTTFGTVWAGSGNDVIGATNGKNILVGGAGNDTFAFTSTSSTRDSADVIADFRRAGNDKIDLSSFAGSVNVSYDSGSGISTITTPDDAAGFLVRVKGEVQKANIIVSHDIAIARTGISGSDLTALNTVLDHFGEYSPQSNELLAGSTVGDTLTVDSTVDPVTGLSGYRTVIGGGGADTIQGQNGGNLLVGGAGNDVFVVNAADSTYAAANIIIDLAAGDKIDLSSFAGTVTLEKQTDSGDAENYDATNPVWFVTSSDNADFFLKVRSMADRTITTADFVFSPDQQLNNAGIADVSAETALINAVRTAVTLDATKAETIGSTAGESVNSGANGGRIVHAGSGDDTVYGDGGNNILLGNAGADTFVFTATNSTSATPDVIADFVSGTDKIDLTAFAGTASIETVGGLKYITSSDNTSFLLKVSGNVQQNDLLLSTSVRLTSIGGSATASTAVRDDLVTETHLANNAAMTTLSANDMGTVGADTIAIGYSATERHFIYGGNGNDVITDVAHSSGTEALGGNIIAGGAGADTFVFGTVVSSVIKNNSSTVAGQYDVIADFVSGTDKIDLSGWAGAVTITTGQTIGGSSDYSIITSTDDATFKLVAKGTVVASDITLNPNKALENIGFSTNDINNITNYANTSSSIYTVVNAAGWTGSVSAAPVLGTIGADNTLNQSGSGHAIIYAGNDADVVYGTGRDNIMFGNAGNDTFVFSGNAHSNGDTPDVVADFVTGSEKIDLSAWAGAVSIVNGTGGALTTITSTDDSNFVLKVNGNVSQSDILFNSAKQLNNAMKLAGGYTTTTATSAANAAVALKVALNTNDNTLFNGMVAAGTSDVGTTAANNQNVTAGHYYFGGAGADIITATGGNAILAGGTGADIFRFAAADSTTATADHVNAILDFTVGSDKVNLTGTGWGTVTATVGTIGGISVYDVTSSTNTDFHLYVKASGTMTSNDFTVSSTGLVGINIA